MKGIIRDEQFEILHCRQVKWTVHDAEDFYKQHYGRFFYDRLCGYMSSAPFLAMVLAKENCIKDWRQLIGPTSPVKYIS